MGGTPVSWIGESAMGTGKGTPWGPTDSRGNWDISKSALNTGAGLPWGPTEENKYTGVPTSRSGNPATTVSGPSTSIRDAFVNPILSDRGQNRLEDQIRLGLRKAQPKNVEFAFNAEQNPYATGGTK